MARCNYPIKGNIFVSNNMDDATMVRIYARENATQRGNNGTAQVGSVASAVRFVAKCVLGGSTREFTSSLDVDVVRQRLTDSRGIGEGVIVTFLDGVTGITPNTVKQALANLKASGDYARIIKEVQEEIERENAEAGSPLCSTGHPDPPLVSRLPPRQPPGSVVVDLDSEPGRRQRSQADGEPCGAVRPGDDQAEPDGLLQ